MLKFAWRNLVRDHRSGELRLIVLSLLVASASLSAVSFFTDRVEQELVRQPALLVGADLVAESGFPLGPEELAKAEALGLDVAKTIEFRSTLRIGEEWKLVEVKAVSPEYPLRGQLMVVAEDGSTRPAGPLPQGHGRVDRRLDRQLGGPGSLRLGELDLLLAETISLEPDRGGELFNIAPRLMMNLDDVAATGLLGPGSRVKHFLMLAGEGSALAEMRRHLGEIPGVRLRGLEDAGPELQISLNRAKQFMGMSSLLTVLLAGLALALAAQRYAARHTDQNALLRCLGAQESYLVRYYAIQLVVIAAMAAVPGCLLGYALQHFLAQIFSELSASGSLPPPSGLPWLLAPIATVVILLGFSLPSFHRLHKVPPLHALRRDDSIKRHYPFMTAGSGVLALVLLAPWRAADPDLTIKLLAGMLATLALFSIAAWLLLLPLRKLAPRASSGWSYGLAILPRNGASSMMQIAAIAVGLSALLLLGQMRGQILESWRQQLPADTPNYFLINIDPAQVDTVAEELREAAGREVPFYPMVRGRLVEINGNKVRMEDYPEGRPRRLVSRNFNLSWLERLPSDNTVIAGEWWGEQDTEPLFTVEREIAEIMGVGLGDALTFDLGGQMHTARIASIREVEWDSFQVNFFVASNPGWLEDAPATWISSIYLPVDGTKPLDELLERMPNITVMDVDVLLKQVRTVVGHIASALELVFLLTLIAGFLVLLAALQITAADRGRDCAVLRTLGARQRWLRQSHATEFVALGVITSALAALVAYAAAAMLSATIFKLDFIADYSSLAIGVAIASLLVSATGIMFTRGARRALPVQSLRL